MQLDATPTPILLDGLIGPVDVECVTEAFAPGVERFTGGETCFRGRREALLDAGVAAPDWFQDGTERDKLGRIRRRKKFLMGDRIIRTREAPHFFEVIISFNPEELTRYWALRDQRTFSRRELPANVIRFPGSQ